MVQVNLRLSEEQVEAIDRLRGGVSRNAWLRDLVEERIHPKSKSRLGPKVENVRSSEQAKRGIGPVPK